MSLKKVSVLLTALFLCAVLLTVAALRLFGGSHRAPSAAQRSTSVASPSASLDLATLSPFVGDWYEFGSTFTVKENGTVTVQYKTFHACATAPAPCDPTEADNSWGGSASGRITEVTGSTARGIVLIANGKSWPAGQAPILLTLGSNNTLDAKISSLTGGYYCGPHSPVGYCGGM